MQVELTGKSIVVTGGSMGIGEVAARTCLEAGARVTICARGEHALVQARDKSWAPLIFQDLFKKDQ